MSDEPPPVALRPWTIKNMPETITERAARAARRLGEPVADLVTRALIRELDQPQPSKQVSLPASSSQPMNELDELERYARISRVATPDGKNSEPMLKVRRIMNRRIDALDARWNGHIDSHTAPARLALTEQTDRAVGSEAAEQPHE